MVISRVVPLAQQECNFYRALTVAQTNLVNCDSL